MIERDWEVKFVFGICPPKGRGDFGAFVPVLICFFLPIREGLFFFPPFASPFSWMGR